MLPCLCLWFFVSLEIILLRSLRSRSSDPVRPSVKSWIWILDLDFRIWTGLGKFDFFFLFPFFSLFGDILRDGSETKSGTNKAFGLTLCLHRGKSESEEKARARGSPTCLIGLGGFSGFILFGIAIAIFAWGRECRVRGRGELSVKRVWSGVGWTGSDRTASWLTSSSSVLGSALDSILDGDLDGRVVGWLRGSAGLDWTLSTTTGTTGDGHEPSHARLTLAASVTVI